MIGERVHGRDRGVAAIMAGAVALRLLAVLLAPQIPYSDGAWYMARAAEMARGMGYQEAGWPTAFWPVGYPAALALTMRVAGPGLLGPLLLNLFAAGATVWLVAWFARRLGGGERAATIAAALYALYPAAVAYTGAPLSETVATAVALAGLALLVAAREGPGWRFVAAGLVFGIGTLMRAQLMLFPIGVLVALPLAFPGMRWRRVALGAAVTYGAMALVVAPWTIRNARVMGAPVPVSTNGGVALYTGANDGATGDWFAWEHGPLWDATGIPFAERVPRQVELDRRFKALATGWIAAHPARWALLAPKKAVLVWHKDTDAFWGWGDAPRAWLSPVRWANQLYYLLLLGLGGAAMVMGLRGLWRRDRQTAPLAVLVLMPAFVTLTAAVFTGQIRYHQPAMPFFAAAAGCLLARAGEKRRAVPHRETVTAAL